MNPVILEKYVNKWLVVFFLVFGVSTTAHANLILNGSFENNDIRVIAGKSSLLEQLMGGAAQIWSYGIISRVECI